MDEVLCLVLGIFCVFNSVISNSFAATIPKDGDHRDVTELKQKMLELCKQTNITEFNDQYPPESLSNCEIIGIGFYGDVYLCGRKVIKVVPVGESDIQVMNGKRQRDIVDAYAEFVVSIALSDLRKPYAATDMKNFNSTNATFATDVFNEVLALHYVKGKYPKVLLDLHNNVEPPPEHLHYMVFELAHAGINLERYELDNEKQLLAIFKQVAFGLAVAEESMKFEHRDLHTDNILIVSTEERFATYVLDGKVFHVEREGAKPTIIDFTHSRITLNNTLYCPPRLITYKFEDETNYMLHIFQLQSAIFNGDWRVYTPYTNILWLHYNLHIMLDKGKFKTSDDKYRKKLIKLKDRILEYKTAKEYVMNELFT